MKLSPIDRHQFASSAAHQATLNIGDAMVRLRAGTEDQIEELLGGEFERVLDRLEVTADGHAFLTEKEDPASFVATGVVTH